MKKQYNISVVIGRFQIPHDGHLACINKAIQEGDRTVVIIGSANAFPSAKNPFDAETREMMLRNAYRERYGALPNTVTFKRVDDNRYLHARWKADVFDCVFGNNEPSGKVGIVGFRKDSGSWWLDEFGWDVIEVEGTKHNNKVLSSTNYRDNLFASKETVIDPNGLTTSTRAWLEWWRAHNPEYTRLQTEHKYIQRELTKFKDYPYRQCLNCCTGDALVTCNGHLLLVKRGGPVGHGAWAFPGGHKNEDETFVDCAIRELVEEVRLKVPTKVLYGSIKNTHLFDDPTRSYIAKPTLAVEIELQPNADGSLPKIAVRDEVLAVEWVPMASVRRNLHQFFEDHACIIRRVYGL